MKIQALAIPALLLLSVLPLACKSTEGHDRAEDTADQVVALGGAAGQTQLQLDKTLAALEQVVADMNQDPKPAYGTFSKSFGSFGDEFAGLGRERAALETRAGSWFTEFERQNSAIQDEELRQTGAKRLADFREQVADTSKQVDKLMDGTSGLQSRLKDLRTYLGNDLTPDGIEAVSGRIADAAKDGRKLAARLGELSKSSETLASKLRAARKPAASPK